MHMGQVQPLTGHRLIANGTSSVNCTTLKKNKKKNKIKMMIKSWPSIKKKKLLFTLTDAYGVVTNKMDEVVKTVDIFLLNYIAKRITKMSTSMMMP